MSYALITGASKGIGRAIAMELAGKGMNLLLVARTGKLLDELAADLKRTNSVKADYLQVDLSQREAALKIFQWCSEKDFDVSVLVNNAGYGLWGFFEKMTLRDQLEMMQVNMQAMVSLTHHFIPILKRNDKSYILNVSSTASFQAVPTLAVYAACKAFVTVFTRGLQYELRDASVSVSCLIPGSTDTEFMDRANMELLKEFAKKFNMSPRKVAKIAVDGMFNGILEIIPGFTNKLSAVGTKLLPKRASEKIAAGIYLKKIKK